MARRRRASDAHLVRRAQQGDRRAFIALLQRFDARLRSLAYGLLVDPQRMDAALRVAYVKAWRDVVRISPKDDVGTWLYRGVYNACIDELRREALASGPWPNGRPGVASARAGHAARPDRGAGAPAREDAGHTNGNGAAGEPETGADEGARVDAVEETDGGGPAVRNGNGHGADEAAGERDDDQPLRPADVGELLLSLSPGQRVAAVLVDREGFSPAAAARIQGLPLGVLADRLRGAAREVLAAAAPPPARPTTSPDPAAEGDAARGLHDETAGDDESTPGEATPAPGTPDDPASSGDVDDTTPPTDPAPDDNPASAAAGPADEAASDVEPGPAVEGAAGGEPGPADEPGADQAPAPPDEATAAVEPGPADEAEPDDRPGRADDAAAATGEPAATDEPGADQQPGRTGQRAVADEPGPVAGAPADEDAGPAVGEPHPAAEVTAGEDAGAPDEAGGDRSDAVTEAAPGAGAGERHEAPDAGPPAGDRDGTDRSRVP